VGGLGEEGLGPIGLMLRSLVRMKKGEREKEEMGGGDVGRYSFSLSLSPFFRFFIFMLPELGLSVGWCVDTLCLLPDACLFLQ